MCASISTRWALSRYGSISTARSAASCAEKKSWLRIRFRAIDSNARTRAWFHRSRYGTSQSSYQRGSSSKLKAPTSREVCSILLSVSRHAFRAWAVATCKSTVTPSHSCKRVRPATTCLLYTSDAADEEDSVDLG